MASKIPFSHSPKQGITHGMYQYIRIGVADQSLCVRYVQAAQYQLAAPAQRVYVVAESNSHASSFFLFIVKGATDRPPL